MCPSPSAPMRGSASAVLVLADGYRVAQAALGTALIGLIPVAITVGNATDWAPWAGIVSASVLLPAWLVLVVRAARSRVAVSPAGIQVRRVFSTRTITPEDYDGVTWSPTLFPSAGASLAIRRKSGRPVSAPAAMSMVKKPFRPVENEVAELGEQITVWLTGPPAGSHPHAG